jgi:hypothetical protein
MLFKLWKTIDRSNTYSFCAIIVYIHSYISKATKSNNSQRTAVLVLKLTFPNVQLLQRFPYKEYSRF